MKQLWSIIISYAVIPADSCLPCRQESRVEKTGFRIPDASGRNDKKDNFLIAVPTFWGGVK
ncbi:MAG: hypothetical protein HZA10_00985 [Nitrospirae bacterium]|nr:hypothetical protein [Nitrospirota bacterium]